MSKFLNNFVVTITCTKEGVRFYAEGDIGNGAVSIKQGEASIDEEEEELETTIEMTSPVSLTFSLKYLSDFAKATPLSNSVVLSMSNDSPLLVEYKVGDIGYVRYYLAPKMTDEN